jgi:hypothetical protein
MPAVVEPRAGVLGRLRIMVGVWNVRAVVIAVALLAAGCDAGAGGSGREGAGSRMDSVLVVPEGTELLGTVFPAALGQPRRRQLPPRAGPP